MKKISVVINTKNEEKNIVRALSSIRQLADEIIVVDMFSTDRTVALAKKAGAKVYTHRSTGYVEPARNFAISRATGDWILVLDADEEIAPALAKTLKKIVSQDKDNSFYRLPRKNIIFGQWIKHSRWWPDYNIRFFKKGNVIWSEIIHSVPETHGRGVDLLSVEDNVIVHHEYGSIGQYVDRLNRYTDIQASQLTKDGYKFSWQDIIRRPTSEFLSRFLAGEGYKDGLHGLALALLQAFSEVVLYLKIWEHEKFRVQELVPAQLNEEIGKAGSELDHWLTQKDMRRKGFVRRLAGKLLR